ADHGVGPNQAVTTTTPTKRWGQIKPSQWGQVNLSRPLLCLLVLCRVPAGAARLVVRLGIARDVDAARAAGDESVAPVPRPVSSSPGVGARGLPVPGRQAVDDVGVLVE